MNNFQFFVNDSKMQIESLVSEFNSLGELGPETESKIRNLIKGYIKLGYNVPTPEMAYKTTFDDMREAIERFISSDKSKNKQLESEFAILLSALYNRLHTCKRLCQINVDEMGEIRKRLISNMVNCKNEKECGDLMQKFVQRIEIGKYRNEEVKNILEWLNQLFEIGSKIFELV